MSDSSSRTTIRFDPRAVPLFVAGVVLIANGLGVDVPDVILWPSYAGVVVSAVIALYYLVTNR